jgi:hypothetical protein
MKNQSACVIDRFIQAGYREAEPGCLISQKSARVISIAPCPPEPEAWPEKTEELLRNQTMRLAPSWSRCVILLVGKRKNSRLAWAAAAFAQEVSKCRRLVLFLGEDEAGLLQLPFIALPALSGSAGAPPGDIEGAIRSLLPATLAEAFLREDLATARIQDLAEEEEC